MRAARRLLVCVFLSGICIYAGACAEKERAIPRVEITSPAGDKSGDVIISYILFDKEGLPASITVKYSIDGSVPVEDATEGPGGDGTTALSSSLRGVAHSYVWDSRQDIGDTNHNDIIISITPTTRRTGKTAYTRLFTVKNFIFSPWADNVRVDDGGAGFLAEAPAICADLATIYAAWADNRSGNYDIFYSLSLDCGDTWSAAVKASDDSGTEIQSNPAIATDGAGKVFLVWQDRRGGDYDIYVSVGYDSGGGFAFGPNVRVDDGGTGDAISPSIAVEGSKAYVVWSDDRNGNYDIFCSCSTDGGANWSASVMANDGAAGDAQSPSLAVAGGILYAAWCDDSDGNYDVFCSLSTDDGATWSTAEKLNTGTTGDATAPAVAVEGITVYVAWSDARTDSGDIYFRHSTDGGSNWDPEKEVNTDTGTALQSAPSLVASGANVYVVWQDFRDSDANIYFAESTNSGISFGPEVRIDDDVTSAVQSAPAVSIQGSAVIVAFQDMRNTDADIYFTRK